jgi:SAM-dependent methyltransferase
LAETRIGYKVRFMLTAIGVARAAFEKMPPPAQRAVTRIHDRKLAAAAKRDLRPFLQQLDAGIGGFNGKRIVEIGSDHAGSTLSAIGELYTPRELIGLNPAFESRQVADSIAMRQVSAENSGLADESVDAVISSSAFEHVSDLPAVLKEMHRVLVPGGLLYSHFGPLWSTSYGHHLWITYQDKLFNYHNVLLPPWCHLLLDEADIRARLRSEYGEELGDRMTDFVYHSDEQNGKFFDDYERMVAESPFETVFLKGYDATEIASKYPAAHSPKLLDELRRRFPERRGFLYDGITMLLRRAA